ncbi:MAG: protein kinase [Longimicrobiales bacterium]|nr:protein kinase [Longimicrobiales bacterium]
MTNEIIQRLNAALEGRYRVEEELGEGGMATVYLADDLRHNRKVALKVLKPELAAVVGAERFLTEIETTANLQHPHILPLFDSGEADSFLFYVMPYVDGETLRDRLERERQLPVHEAVGIAVSLAGALDHAHRKGVIHRDIKPANILLQDGQPVIADFGIALAVGSAGGARLTETGLSVGTPYYMSPEQATGDQHVGPQSDIYALTCVLYEMLVGEPPFPGQTAQAVLGRIISGEYTPVTRQRPSIAPNVDAAIRKGLEKISADRFSTAEELAKALQDPGFRHGELGVGAADGGRWRTAALAASAAAALFAGVAGWALLSGGEELPVTRYAVQLPENHDPSRAYGANVAVSPDGRTIVYAGPTTQEGVGLQLWMRRRDQLDPTAIAGTEQGISPSFSPDGTRIAFVAGPPNVVRIISLTGEPPITVADSAVGGNSVSWGDDGFVYFDVGNAAGIARVPSNGGDVEVLTQLDSATAEGFHAWPDVLPGSRGVIATIGYFPISDANAYRIAAFDVETGEKKILLAGVQARYSPSGHLLYVSADGLLLAVPFDADAMEVTGPPSAMMDGLSVGQFGSADLQIAEDGTLVYMAGPTTSGLGRAVWVDREGRVTPVDPDWAFDPGMPEAALALSPDGTRLAVKINTEAGEDIWVKELDDGPLSRLTFDDGIDRRPQWSRDGTRIFYTSDRGGEGGSHYDLWEQPADGTGSPALVLDLEGSILEARLTPEEETFALRLGGLSGAVGVRDIVGLRRNEDGTFPVATEPYDEKALALSPSGTWIAYESTETGRDEVYVRPFPDAEGGKWQISTNGGINPKWAHSEEEIFFINGNGELVAAQIRTEGGFRVGERRTLFSMADLFLDGQPNYASWDVAPDDQRFMMLQIGGGEGDEASRLVVVQSFFKELGERAER